ncbi:MAG: hypothetical protein GY803_20825 [Chloroflexi bacterium]|nr:hypothetical protein [Chloroflexota bacterium]
MTVQEEINLIAERIIQLYRPDKIILFGSWARDDAEKQSDLEDLKDFVPKSNWEKYFSDIVKYYD